MYQKYHTDALVLGSRPAGEADKMCALYTRDFGLVWAGALGARLERSKMRYALSHLTRARVSLVRGKHDWRIAGCAAENTAIEKSSAGVAACARIAQLTIRLVAGEERNEYLFCALAEAHAVLMVGCEVIGRGSQTSPGGLTSTSSPATVELVCVARMLYALGYLSAGALGEALFVHTAYGMEHLREAEGMRDELLVSINQALAQTHL